MASEMAWVCHVIFFIYVYIYTNYSIYLYVMLVLRSCVSSSVQFSSVLAQAGQARSNSIASHTLAN